MTRAAPARILGLSDRGSLKPGKIADISLYDQNQSIDKMFSKAKYVFKNGKEVIKDGKILNIVKGSTQSLILNYDKKIRKDIKKWFDKFYSLELDTFEVDENFFGNDNFKYIRKY